MHQRLDDAIEPRLTKLVPIDTHQGKTLHSATGCNCQLPVRAGGHFGVHIKAVADLPGHSSISITADVYGQTSGEAARSAVDGWSGALGYDAERVFDRALNVAPLTPVVSDSARPRTANRRSTCANSSRANSA